MSLNGNNVIGSSGHRTNQPPYEIDQSLRFNDGDTPYLSRTPSSAGNRKAWTLSVWVKLGGPDGLDHAILDAWQDGSNIADLSISGEEVNFHLYQGGSHVARKATTRLLRDPSSWYHIVYVWDSANSTAGDRMKIYVNGERQTDFRVSIDPSQDLDSVVNNAVAHNIGRQNDGSEYWNGYMAEYHFIDGTALDASSFGETNSSTNQWVPIEYDGSYGTNGFYLKFQDSSALGDDSSGNTNDFTATNLAATDQVLDSPTNNFATLSPIAANKDGSSCSILTEGNLKIPSSSSATRHVRGATIDNLSLDAGKWYYEIYVGAANSFTVGYRNAQDGDDTPSVEFEQDGQYKVDGGNSGSATGTISNGDILGVLLDWSNTSAKTFAIYVNNSLVGSAKTFTANANGYNLFARGSDSSGNGGNLVYNFGQDSSFAGAKTAQGNTDGNGKGDFYYTPPSGFVALCSDNLPDVSIKPEEHFKTVLYTGTGASHTISSLDFAPDFTWHKSRSYASSNALFDSVRGGNKVLSSNGTDAEVTNSDMITAFSSNGFTMGADATQAWINQSSYTYASWNWKAGGTAVSNTDGSITSSVSANTTAGFSIVSYTGTGSTATVGHGLSVAPELLIVKNRTDSGTAWQAGSDALTSWLYYITLSSTAAQNTSTQMWNSTAPTSSVFTVKDAGDVNTNTKNYIAYCFHGVEGYSKVGSYTANANADGPFVYTGFRPAFLMVKGSSQSVNWDLIDAARNPYNILDKRLAPNTSGADDTSAVVDFLSNGFKVRTTSGGYNDPSSATYIYLAFAESPFKTSNAR